MTLESVLKKSTGLGFSNLSKAQEKKILSLLNRGLLELKKERKKEGEATRKVLEKDLKICLKLLASINKEVKCSKELLQEQFYKKASQMKVDVPEDRLALEWALLIEKSDVSEELERLRVHFEEFKKTLYSKI